MSKKSRPNSGAGKFLRRAGYGLFLLLVLAVGSTAGWLSQSEVVTHMVKMGFNPRAPQDTFKANTVTLLILGCDEDLSTGGKRVLKKQARSDMMLIAKLDFDHNMVTGVSIPRDTRCKLPGYRAQKINAYHNIAKKGHEAELTQQAVEFLLPGVKIDRVVTLDFDHFQNLVDMVGGVPITIATSMNYDDNAGNLHIHLMKGARVLNGYDSMAFVRFRHADSDLVREERQKQFLLAFKQRAMKDWLKVPQLVNEGQEVLGGALTTDEIASIALFARQVPSQNIQWGQIPVKDTHDHTYDFLVDENKLDSVLTQYRLIDTHDSAASIAGGSN